MNFDCVERDGEFRWERSDDGGPTGHVNFTLHLGSSPSVCAAWQRLDHICGVLFWPSWVFVAACRLSLVTVSGGYCLVVACGLLIAVASLVVKHWLWVCRLQ